MEKFTLINKARSSIKVFEPFEDSSENSEDIISENEDIDLPESNTKVKRLSLFDTLDKEASLDKPDNTVNENTKLEPILDDNKEQEEANEESYPEEFSSEEELEESSEEEDINQDTNEELLDIPTFLRRQAN